MARIYHTHIYTMADGSHYVDAREGEARTVESINQLRLSVQGQVGGEPLLRSFPHRVVQMHTVGGPKRKWDAIADKVAIAQALRALGLAVTNLDNYVYDRDRYTKRTHMIKRETV